MGHVPPTAAVTQASALREIVETWDESSGSFLPVPDRRRGPKGDPGERGPPGKEVCAGCSVGGALWRVWLYSHQLPLFCSSRDPSASLETVGQREIVETQALRGHLAWPLGRGAPLGLPAWPGSLESLVFLGSQARLGVWESREGPERG